ncbi:MAG: A/G-specific adenine glycosylase [Alphaproteobacteria bacterium]
MTQQTWPNRLLLWFDTHKRTMPWRADKDNKVEPWQTWVSEVMLQQTTVATVMPRYLEFMERWPSFNAFLQISEDEIYHFWQGLGYYSRARNLYKGIQYIKSEYGGQLPQDLDKLKKIPGLGDYTAAAIASIAFNQKAAAIDGNVARLFARFWLMDDIGEKLKQKQRKQLLTYIPDRAGDFTQALIELGALICRPNQPQCTHCPIVSHCKAFNQGKVNNYPIKQVKKAKEIRYAQFYRVYNRQGEILFFKRPNQGLLASMYVLPSNNWYNDDTSSIEDRLKNSLYNKALLYEYKHIFTHIELRAKVYNVTMEHIIGWNDAYWVSRENLAQIALPTVIKKALKDL